MECGSFASRHRRGKSTAQGGRYDGTWNCNNTYGFPAKMETEGHSFFRMDAN
jgi:hypothetical protein